MGVGTLLRDGKVWAEQMFPKMSASAVFPWFPELNKQKHPNLQGSYKNSRFSSGFKAQEPNCVRLRCGKNVLTPKRSD